MEPSLCFSALSQIGSSLGSLEKLRHGEPKSQCPLVILSFFILALRKGGPLASERARAPPIKVRERGLTQSLDWVS